jgi:hypothetical protein
MANTLYQGANQAWLIPYTATVGATLPTTAQTLDFSETTGIVGH